MNNSFIKLASIICVSLSLIIASEWFLANLSQQQLLENNIIKAQESKPDEMPSIDLTEPSEDSYVDLVDRPLFIAGRRPVIEPPPINNPTQMVAGGMPSVFDWQLSGVYTKDKKLSVLLSHAKIKLPKAKDNYRKLSIGDALEGWQISDIKLDRVIFKQGSNVKELPLHKPKVKELPKPPDPNEQPAPAPEGEPAPDAAPEEQPNPEPETESSEAPQGDFENSNAHF